MSAYARAVDTPVPFLWLCGPSGVGKSTVGWEIFSQLARAGSATAYVDADQLGLCYPAPADDPQNHRTKARNLGAVWAAFRTAGVDAMVLSGGVGSDQLVRAYVDQVPGAAITLCRLRADHTTLTDRFVRRGWMPQLADEAVVDADDLDRLDFADLCVDTDGLSITEVGTLVRDRADGWPAPSGTRVTRVAGPADVAAAATGARDPMPVLLLCGPTAVGKSTVGYDIFTRVQAGIKAAYVDLAQIGFCQPAPADDPGNHRLKAANLAAMWPAFHEAGARCLIMTGQVSDTATIRAYADALPAMTLTVCRLHAGRETLTDRILSRGNGNGPAIPGDELKGQPSARLLQVAERAARDADELHRAGLGDLWVDTDKRSAEDVAQLVIAATDGWPSARREPWELCRP
jgi:adenylylsulfate kinase-like enzyme